MATGMTAAQVEMATRNRKEVALENAIKAVKAFAKENELTVEGALVSLEEAMLCEGHESTSGSIGSVIYCDGTCR